MASSSEGRCSEIASDLFIILITAAQLIFFTRFYGYIAWYTRGTDGSLTRLWLLTDDYFTWLPFPIITSIIVIVATVVMLIYNREWFRETAWIGFCLLGISVVVSLVAVFPFDFGVIPDPTAATAVPVVVTVFLILMAIFYGISALVLAMRLIRNSARGHTGGNS
jgi:hypothetical protein